MSASLMCPVVNPFPFKKGADGFSKEESRGNQLSRFFELSPDLFCIVEMNGYFKILNRSWETVVGFSRESLLAVPWIEFVHPQDRDSTTVEVQTAGSGGAFSFENRFRCQDGSYKWLLWNAVATPEQRIIYASARDITGLRAAEAEREDARDELESRIAERTAELAKINAVLLAEITHCRQIEASLCKAKKKYQSIFENAVEGIFQSTPDGMYISVNPALARIKGYNSSEEMIEGVKDIGQQTYVDPNRRLDFKSLMEQHGVVSGFEYEVHRKDGKRIWLSTNARAVFDSDNTVEYYEGMIEDITERKHLEEQLRQAQKMEAVGQLAGGIAHDFNNLLGVIIGHGDLLLEKLREGDPLCNHVEQITKASKSAASLVGQLLAFSRQQIVQPVVLDLNSVVQDVAKMVSSVAGDNISLKTFLDSDLGRVKADRGQIEQILVNLIINARDAMPNGGRLTIETANVHNEGGLSFPSGQAPTGPAVMLSVTDSGIGMDAETQSHIFEPFFTTKERGKGTGLGLASVYGSVKQCGGSIWVQSESGHGSTFRIFLPRVDETEVIALSDGPIPKVSGSETVLLAEDDPSLREFILTVLISHGYRVLEAADGLQALSIGRQFDGPIHLLLSDVVMPGPCGPQVADELAHIRPDMRTLFISGYPEFAGDHHFHERGESLLPKPFTQKDLVRKLREVLEIRPNSGV